MLPEENIEPEDTQEPETIEPTDMTDEQLEKALAPIADPITTEEPQEEPDADKSGDAPTKPETLEDRVVRLESENSSLSKQRSDKDRYINKLQEEKTAKADRVKELESEIGVGSVINVDNFDQHTELRDLKKEVAVTDSTITETLNRTKLDELVPDLKELLPQMLEIGRSNGDPAHILKAFEDKPESFDVGIVSQIAREARLLSKIAKLEQTKARLTTVDANIAQVATQPTITNSGGSTAPQTGDMSVQDMSTMSDEALGRLLS